MPLLFICVTNSKFKSRDEGSEYAGPEAALEMGVRSAITLLAEEVKQGKQNSAIEIRIETEDGTQLLRSIVAVSISTLLPCVRLD